MLKSFFSQGQVEAGCDEAGRGCLAGPVFAAAVILPENFSDPLLNDSKLLREKDRLLLRDVIISRAIDFAVARVDAPDIDRINILQASLLAMHLALDALQIKPMQILVDGNRFRPYASIPHHTIIKGDGIYASIAAASVLAKTSRDAFMKDCHNAFPVYSWNINKGYPTRVHREAIRDYGLSPYHRKTFRCLPIGEP